MRSHSDCETKEASHFMKCNVFDQKHEGIIEVNFSNVPTKVKFDMAVGEIPEIAVTDSKINNSQVTNSTQSNCSAVLAQSKSSLTNITRFKVSKLGKYDGIPPKGRTQNLYITSSGIRGELTPLTMAKRIISSCLEIGSVRFVANGTDDQSVYGLLNGKVQIFRCTGIDNPNRWGEYACS
jgi:hypothetical protein